MTFNEWWVLQDNRYLDALSANVAWDASAAKYAPLVIACKVFFDVNDRTDAQVAYDNAANALRALKVDEITWCDVEVALKAAKARMGTGQEDKPQ